MAAPMIDYVTNNNSHTDQETSYTTPRISRQHFSMLKGSEIAKHRSRDSLWIVIHGKVYDCTSFLPQHPGGSALLLKQGGTDATKEYDQIHSLEVLEQLPTGSCLGDIDPMTTSHLFHPGSDATITVTPKGVTKVSDDVPSPLALMITANDFRAQAKKVLSKRGWIYVSSSANNGLSLKHNLASWSLVSFRPRMLRNVSGKIDTSIQMLGQTLQVPFFVPPMGTLGMAHVDAEYELVRGLARAGTHGVISTASTKSVDGIMETWLGENRQLGKHTAESSRLSFQLYVPEDRARAVNLIRKVKKAGYQNLWLTIDTPVLGKRREDRRLQAEEVVEAAQAEQEQVQAEQTSQPQTTVASDANDLGPAVGARIIPGQLDAGLTWDDLDWLKREWENAPSASSSNQKLQLVLKGVQNHRDAALAAAHPTVSGILLSNHGGRQLHTAPPALVTLLEIRTYCPEVLDQIEVFVDGGCRDGADVVKALCLGAKAVGVGRPYFYALGAYGAKGVERCSAILKEEVELTMRLLGVTSIDQLEPEMVNTAKLLNEIWRDEREYKTRSRL